MIEPIWTIGPDDFPTCGECGRRSDTLFETRDGVVSPKLADVEDPDGPVFVAKCPEHGRFLFKIEEDE